MAQRRSAPVLRLGSSPVAQPDYAPITEPERVRPAYRLRTPGEWRTDRVAEITAPEQPRGPELGVPGPDQGYALKVAEDLFEKRLSLSAGVTPADALHGCAAVACARAARLGRAPVGKDVEMALVLFGFLGDAPEDLIAWRTPMFQAAGHDCYSQRRIVDSVAEEALMLTPDQVRERLADWRTLVVTG